MESHFVRSIRGLPNFLAIPIMNPLTRVHDEICPVFAGPVTYITVHTCI